MISTLFFHDCLVVRRAPTMTGELITGPKRALMRHPQIGFTECQGCRLGFCMLASHLPRSGGDGQARPAAHRCFLGGCTNNQRRRVPASWPVFHPPPAHIFSALHFYTATVFGHLLSLSSHYLSSLYSVAPLIKLWPRNKHPYPCTNDRPPRCARPRSSLPSLTRLHLTPKQLRLALPQARRPQKVATQAPKATSQLGTFLRLRCRGSETPQL